MSAPTSSMSQAVQLALEDLTDKIEVIDARSETKLVVFGNIIFKSRDEVKEFVQLYLTRGNNM